VAGSRASTAARDSPELEKITVPVLAAANWAHHLHTRGNFEGYSRVASSPEVTGDSRTAALGGVLQGLEFWTPPLERDLEITGPAAGRLRRRHDTAVRRR